MSWWDDGGSSSGVSMWRTEWGNIRTLQEQLDQQAAHVAMAASEQRRLSSQLSKLQGDLAQRVDRLAAAFDAFVELSQLRDELVLHADAKRWRLAARRLVEGTIARTALPAGGPTMPAGDVDGYWLAPAVRGLPEAIERGGDDGTLDEAAKRDELRTATFVAAVAPLLGAQGLASRWVPSAFPASGSGQVTRAERALWLAATDGLLPSTDLTAVVSALEARLAASSQTADVVAMLAAGAPASPGPVAADAVTGDAGKGPAGTIERWAGHVERLAAATGTEPGSTDVEDDLLSVVRSLVEEGSVEERPLLDRAEQLGVLIDPGLAGSHRHWDDQVGTVAELLVADAADGQHPQRARTALALLRTQLLAAAERLVDQTVVAPPANGDVRIGGRVLQLAPDGTVDAVAFAAATSMPPTPRRLTPVAVAGLAAALVLSIVLGVAVAPGWLLLGGLAAIAGAGLWWSDRTAARRDVELAAATAASARRTIDERIAAIDATRTRAAADVARATAARARLAGALGAADH